jgi:hypothetical protein
MPFADYKFPQGALTAAQKKEIIHKTTGPFAHYFWGRGPTLEGKPARVTLIRFWRDLCALRRVATEAVWRAKFRH